MIAIFQQPQSFGIDNNENAIESEFAYEAQVSSGLKEEKEGRLEALILRLHARANGET